MEETVYKYLHGELVEILVYTDICGDDWWKDCENVLE